MPNPASLHVIIEGHVQGVSFRAFVEEHATALNLTGYVRNSPDRHSVEVEVEGDKESLEKLLEDLKTGPPAAEVHRVITHWGNPKGKRSHFEIRY